jgi:hypothetical protein
MYTYLYSYSCTSAYNHDLFATIFLFRTKLSGSHRSFKGRIGVGLGEGRIRQGDDRMRAGIREGFG